MSPENQPRPSHAGTVTRLEVQKNDVNRVSVYLDGDFAFGVHQDLVLRFELRKGRVLTLDEQIAIERADQVMKARAKAFDYLSYKPRTETEVRRRLGQKGFDDAVVDQVIDRLFELNYLDDAAYAVEYARGRFESGGYGPRRVRHDLRRRGVARRHIEDAVAEVFDRDEALDTAREQAHKRLRRLQREEDPRRRRKKLFDFLVRRGFTYETARRVVDEVAESEGWESRY